MVIQGYPVTLPRHINGLPENPLRPRTQAAGDASSNASAWWALGLTVVGLGLWELASHKLSSYRPNPRRRATR